MNKRVVGTEVIPLSQRYLHPADLVQTVQTVQAVQQAPQVNQIQKQMTGYEQTHTDRMLVTTPPVYQTMYVPVETSCWKRCFGYQPSCCSHGGCCGPERCMGCCPGQIYGTGGCGPCCNGPCCAACTLI